MKKRIKTVKAWAVLEAPTRIMHSVQNFGQMEVFISKREATAWSKEVVPCIITYALPIKKKGK